MFQQKANENVRLNVRLTTQNAFFLRAFCLPARYSSGMTIWILALVIMASLAGIGLRQGAIRVAFSLCGILLGALLAQPLAHFVKPIFHVIGVKSPLWLWILPPVLVFLIILTIFKVVGFTIHRKAEVYYRHKVLDIQLALWERLNHRLGLCLGLANGTVYLVLASFAIYTPSYWTYQMVPPDSTQNVPKVLKLFNRMGKDLEDTGMSQVAGAVDTLPQSYYNAADIVGLIYANPLLQARLTRYPDFLGLGERSELQDLAHDSQFTEMWLKRAPISEIIKYPKVQAIIQNPDLMKIIWSTLIPDLKDLQAYLETGKSEKYDQEPILGRWDFSLNATIGAFRRAKPNVISSEMQKFRQWLDATYAKAVLVAAPDKLAVLKQIPDLQATAAKGSLQLETLRGKWKKTDDKYELDFNGNGKSQTLDLTLENERLSFSEGIPGGSLTLVFTREE